MKTFFKMLLPSILKWATKLMGTWLNDRQTKKEAVKLAKKEHDLITLNLKLEQAIEARDEKEIIRLHMLIATRQ